MIRNLVLLVGSAAILGLIFLGYSRIVSDPRRSEESREAEQLALPAARGGGEPLTIGDVTVPPGGRFHFTRYDPNTGKPRERISGSEWRPVPGSRDEVFVIEPELTLRLPSGMLATIRARDAQMRIDRVNNRQAEPKLGRLSGGVRIDIDRETQAERSPLAERPEDRIAISMSDMDFDLELGRLSSAGKIEIKSVLFTAVGAGLSLEWNRAANRLERLELARGEELVLLGGNGLFGAMEPPPAAASESSPATGSTSGASTSGSASQGAAAQGAAVQGAVALDERSASRRRPTTYLFSLSGGVEADQRLDGASVGGLSASALRILFDMGGGGSGVLPGRSATRPAGGERMVLKWGGPLLMTPIEGAPPAERARKRFFADGPRVELRRGDARIECGGLEYFDDTQQVWLRARRDGPIAFQIGPATRVRADAVYVDRSADLVKLIGNVAIESDRSAEAGAKINGDQAHARHGSMRSASGPSGIRAALWAELYLEPRTAPVAKNGPGDDAAAIGAAPEAGHDEATADATAAVAERPSMGGVDPLLGGGGIRRAVFAGDVVVGMGDQALTAQRIDAHFRPRIGDEPFEALLREAIAGGEARLTGAGESLSAQEIRVTFANDERGALFPRRLDANGAVDIRQERNSIRGERVVAELGAPPEDKSAAFVLQALSVQGRAQLRAPADRVSVRGRQIEAVFSGASELHHAVVRGDEAQPGRVRAGEYAVLGEEILIDQPAQSLRVDGRSRLELRTSVGLRGERRTTRERLTIRSSRSLHVDGRGNLVTFAGDVEARSGDEALLADRLTLTLRDAEPVVQRADPLGLLVGGWRTELRRIGWLAAPRPAPFASSQRPAAKEPLLLEASNAAVLSEAPDPAGGAPLVHSSIRAPQIRVDIPTRVIYAVGRTSLLMTNRRMSDSPQTADPAEGLGLPSALVSGGPNQTAMQSEGGMTYAIGSDRDGVRRDSVLFEGGVVFAHRAGREMVDLATMLPGLVEDEQALAKLRSRATLLECARLEATFAAGAADAADRMQLDWLVAHDSVFLRDRQGDGIREVRGDRLEFDRARAIVGVMGSPARIEFLNVAANRYDQPAVGPRFEIDLNTGMPRAAEARGEFNRR
ncbi:MAG: hypothetical protein IPM64_16200 [Phycisphaerales bacterium]|nr:hypothetical protein [Phycisphaerales bacterium]